ncbi:DUF6176 family protein [Haloferax elongans]|nr:DUF6176 family protein [Haloferax elongans]
MSEVQFLRYRLKDGQRDRLYEWMEAVTSRRDEALATLQDENVYSEAAFLESRPDGEYVCFYMEAEDLEAAAAAFEASPHDIDRQFKQLLSEVVAEEQPDEEIEPLYHLVNPDRP